MDTRDASDPRELFLGSLGQRIAGIEREIPRIARQPGNREATDALVKLTQQARRDAEGVAFAGVVEVLRGVERLAEALRDRTLSFVPGLGETILLAFERARLFAEGDQAADPDAADVGRVADVLEAVVRGGDAGRDANLSHALNELAGSETWEVATSGGRAPAPSAEPVAVVAPARGPLEADLRSFRDLSLRLERRSPHWDGRTNRLVRLALEANGEAGNIVDPLQLEAAVYMHDVGMAFLSESFWKRQGPLGDAEWQELREHPTLGANLLGRMSRWTLATEIVAQHHERPAGTGYPRGLRESEITSGAKLLAILDAFEAMTHERADRPNRKSVMRSMAEINACVDQFSRDWVKIVNRVVRRMLIDPERDTGE